MSSKFKYYSAYGLIIRSSIKLPGSEIESKEPDLEIRFGELTNSSSGIPRECILSDGYKVIFTSDGLINLFWQDERLCNIKNDHEIIVNPKLHLTDCFLSLLIIGFAIPILLQLRDVLVLHANAIQVNSKLIVLIGPKGAGKSTTSFIMYKNGHKLIADDLLAVKIEKSSVSAFAGFNTIKIWPDIIRCFNEDPNKSSKIHSDVDKRFYIIKNNPELELIPIDAIYLIKEGNATQIKDLPVQDAILELIKSTLWTKTFDKTALSTNLEDCGEIVKKIPVKILEIKKSFSDFSTIVEIIENEVEDLI